MFCHGELVTLKPAPDVSDAVLSDDLARRRARLGAGRHRRAARAAGVLRARRRARRRRLAAAVAGAAGTHRLRRARRRRRPGNRGLRGVGHHPVLRRHDRHQTQFLRRPAGPGVRPRQFQSSPVADPRHDPARDAVHGAGVPPARDDLLHDHVGHRPPARGAASQHEAAQGRRDRSRDRHARGLRRQGRCLPLLRHQPRRHAHRATRVHVPAGQRRNHRARAGRCASVARAGAGAAVRRARDRRVLERRDPRAPHHGRSARRCIAST